MMMLIVIVGSREDCSESRGGLYGCCLGVFTSIALKMDLLEYSSCSLR